MTIRWMLMWHVYILHAVVLVAMLSGGLQSAKLLRLHMPNYQEVQRLNVNVQCVIGMYGSPLHHKAQMYYVYGSCADAIYYRCWPLLASNMQVVLQQAASLPAARTRSLRQPRAAHADAGPPPGLYACTPSRRHAADVASELPLQSKQSRRRSQQGGAGSGESHEEPTGTPFAEEQLQAHTQDNWHGHNQEKTDDGSAQPPGGCGGWIGAKLVGPGAALRVRMARLSHMDRILSLPQQCLLTVIVAMFIL